MCPDHLSGVPHFWETIDVTLQETSNEFSLDFSLQHLCSLNDLLDSFSQKDIKLPVNKTPGGYCCIKSQSTATTSFPALTPCQESRVVCAGTETSFCCGQMGTEESGGNLGELLVQEPCLEVRPPTHQLWLAVSFLQEATCM